MIERMLLFGATGDLANRFLLPALAELRASGDLPERFQIFATGRRQMTDEEYRGALRGRLEEFAQDTPIEHREALLSCLRYRAVDLSASDLPEKVGAVLKEMGAGDGGEKPVAVYLALPPSTFESAVSAIAAGGLPEGSRVVVEKPFGEDLEGAVRLNRLLRKVAGAAGEKGVYRVDHVLGMATVHNLLGIRLANRILEPIWSAAHIEEIEILWEETLALEGRAGYYDRTGALKDVMQNHMLQILSLIAMEPPSSLNEQDLRDRKVGVLRSVRRPDPGSLRETTRRARYTAGHLADSGGASGAEVPDYADEEGVDPGRGTETFAEVELELESWRWAGTRFVLRAGKALAQRRKEVIVRFRPVPHLPFDPTLPLPERNELRIGIDGPESLTLNLTGSMPGPPTELVPLSLNAPLPAAERRAYAQVMLDILSGDATLSIRGDEAEEAWRIMTPILEAWAEDRVPLEEYPAGSSGLSPRRHRSDSSRESESLR